MKIPPIVFRLFVLDAYNTTPKLSHAVSLKSQQAFYSFGNAKAKLQRLVQRGYIAPDSAECLLEFGLGLTNLCNWPTSRANELTAAERRHGRYRSSTQS